jgi:hypothetical protein
LQLYYKRRLGEVRWLNLVLNIVSIGTAILALIYENNKGDEKISLCSIMNIVYLVIAVFMILIILITFKFNHREELYLKIVHVAN